MFFYRCWSWALMAAGQTQSTTHRTPPSHATLQQVDVMRGDDGINVEITARGHMTPKCQHAGIRRPALW